MKLLIVILNYKVTGLTIDCLRSLAPEVARTPGVKVAVLENGTSAEAFATLEAAIRDNGWQDWTDLSRVEINRGFTGGNNIVLRAALARPDAPPYMMMLNADTIVEAGALEALIGFMDQKPAAGIAGSLLLSPEGEHQASGFRFPTVASEFDRSISLGIVSRLLSRWALVLPAPPAPAPADWVPGASMILRSAMLREIGLLDEGLYTYFDDIDICHRARKAGWETWVVPESRVIHLEGASTGVTRARAKRLPRYWFEARRRCFLTHFGPLRTALMDGALITGFSLAALRRLIQRKPDTNPPHLLRDHITGSVFAKGFAIPTVENPALAPHAAR